jgi:hypothetical protein
VSAPLDGLESNSNESDIPERVWAVEGCIGIGKHIVHRLVAKDEAVAESAGEEVRWQVCPPCEPADLRSRCRFATAGAGFRAGREEALPELAEVCRL